MLACKAKMAGSVSEGGGSASVLALKGRAETGCDDNDFSTIYDYLRSTKTLLVELELFP